MKNNYIVLLFHGIDGKDFYSIDLKKFKSILSKIKQKDVNVTSIEDKKLNEDYENKKYISITFDDGLITDYSKAFPNLLENNMNASFFVSPNFVGDKGYVSWSNLREMVNYGMQVGSHGLSHKYLSMMSREKLIDEIVRSKKIIEDKLSIPVKSFSIPHDDSFKQLDRVLYENGYTFILNSMPDFNGYNSTKINRISISKNISLNEIESICNFSKKNVLKKKLSYLLRNNLKKIVGINVYMKLRYLKFY